MGNSETTHRSNLHKQRNSYSFDVGDFANYRPDKILPSGQISASGGKPSSSIYRKVNSSLDLSGTIRNIETKNNNIMQSNPDIPTISVQSTQKVSSSLNLSKKQQNMKLQRLTKNNDQLRKQLIQINQKLNIQLQKKKMPILLTQHSNNKSKAKSHGKKDGISKTQQVDKSHTKEKSKLKQVALKKELQNAYNQATRYQKQIEELKRTYSSSLQSQLKKTSIDDQIANFDLQIRQKNDEIESMKEIVEKQVQSMKKAEEEQNSPAVLSAKNQIQQMKEKLRFFKNNQRRKQKDEKIRHAILIELERKVRELNGDYLPEVKNYSGRQPDEQKVSPVRMKKNLKNSRLSSQESPNQTINEQQLLELYKQLQSSKQRHQQYHKKIAFTEKKRNQLREQRNQILQKFSGLQKQMQSLLYKKERYMQIIMTNLQAGGTINISNGTQVFDGSKAGEIVLYGTELSQQQQFSDDKVFKNTNQKQSYKIVTVHVWIGSKNAIAGLQLYYSNGSSMVTGNRCCPPSKQSEEKKVFSLQDESDYIRSVMVNFNGKSKYLEYLILESAKGKVMKFGSTETLIKGENCHYQFSKRHWPTCVSGTCVFDGEYWRVNQLGLLTGGD